MSGRLSFFGVISAFACVWSVLAVDDNTLPTISREVDGFAGDGLPYTRGIEQIVSQQAPFFDAAIEVAGPDPIVPVPPATTTTTFYGLGSASYIDSFDSRNGPYDPTVKDNPSHPWFGDSRHGNIYVGGATAHVRGSIYGDLTTNGGNVTNGNPGIIYGTIDNNVPFSLENYHMPLTAGWNYMPVPNDVSGPTTITPPTGGTTDQPNYYIVYSISSALTINPAVVSGTPVNTYVAIHVTGNISGVNAAITVNPLVMVRIYFDGNIDIKTQNIRNQNPSATNPFAGNLQFYGISPVSGTQQVTLALSSGQPTVAATFYAPSANVHIQGAPDFFGQVVCKIFYANGNVTWHYDRALNDVFGVPMPTPTPTQTPTPTPTVTPTPTPINIISGTISYCSNPAPGPVPNVTLSLTGTLSGSTSSDISGNYQFTLNSGGTYTVTPTKAARTPGSDNINTVDVVAVKQHFLNLGTPLSGCRLTAADVNGDSAVNTVDVVAIQRFFLILSTGIANVGEYQFNPPNRSYSQLTSDQIAQNYDTVIFGDVAAPFVH